MEQSKKQYMEDYKSRMRNLGSVIMKEPEAQDALNNCIVAMQSLSRQMANTDYENCNPCGACNRKGLEPDIAAKTLSYIGKVVNETTRLLEYAKGNADRRTEVKGLEDLLKVLNKDQFNLVCQWIEHAEREPAGELQ